MPRADANERLARLTDRFVGGDDAAAWNALTEAIPLVAPRVLGRLRRQGWPASELDDVFAEAIARTFVARRSVRRLVPYLRRVAFHVALDRRQATSAGPADPAHLVSEPREEPEPAEESDAVRRLRCALAEIDPVDQHILMTFAASPDERSWVADLAAETGLTPNAVRVRKHRAIERLRRRLGGER